MPPQSPAILPLLALVAFAIPTRQGIRREAVTFQSDSLRLAGTLFLPDGDAHPPAAVLIPGSGADDRSSMRYYAELLAGEGVAALAYDKRGVGASQGPPTAWRRFNLDDLALDAAAAVRYLRSRADLDSTRIGLVAASQGGWVAPRTARQLGNVAFIVVLSGSLTTIAEDNLFERAARLGQEGFSAGEVEAARQMHLVDLGVSRTGQDFERFARLWDTHRSDRWFKRVYLDPAPAAADHPYRH